MKTVGDILTGDFLGNASPIHPALVHVPLVLIPTAAVLRAGAHFRYLPATSGAWPLQAAHALTLVALLSMVPTALTGYFESRRIPERKRTAKKKVLQHAALNSAVGLITLYIFMKVRGRAGRGVTPVEVGLGLLSVALLFVSGHLGGELVYQHGLGVRRQGKGRFSHE
jgi:uncharacterized membrane protein